ncbi:MAG: divergent polysaccharide deacetylase family protein [Spirochaetes bacterium]|nr:divergent polysaccharide deacetylase family protein [Spirochaetota bacterium]
MAGKTTLNRKKDLRVFLFFLFSILFLTVSILMVFTEIKGEQKTGLNYNRIEDRKINPDKDRGLLRLVKMIREERSIAIDGFSFSSNPGFLNLRIDYSYSSKAFINLLKKIIKYNRITLQSWRIVKKNPLNLNLTLDSNSRLFIIRAEWQKKKDNQIKKNEIDEDKAQDLIRDNKKVKIKTAKIVIVLDDAGGQGKFQWLFLNLGARITFAVMPHLKNSATFALRAKKTGFETILHAPMMPIYSKKGTLPAKIIKSGMSKNEVFSTLRGFFRSVPGVVGINNHMGSLATCDPHLMGYVMSFLNNKGMYFLDSKTHSGSEAYNVARKYGIPALKRHIFLDNKREYGYIRSRLLDLARLARKHGFAVGIGHVTSFVTYQVLRDFIPKLKKMGFRFIFASELL